MEIMELDCLEHFMLKSEKLLLHRGYADTFLVSCDALDGPCTEPGLSWKHCIHPSHYDSHTSIEVQGA
jgi:hypothetical protein